MNCEINTVDHIIELENKLKLLKLGYENIKQELIKTEQDLVLALRNKYPLVWGICAETFKPNHCSHMAVYFKTKKSAKKYDGTSSINSRNNMKWTYKMVEIDSNTLSDSYILELDEIPYNFPITC